MKTTYRPFCYARVLIGTAFCLRDIRHIKEHEIRNFFHDNKFKGALLPKVEPVEDSLNPRSPKGERNINAWKFLKVALGHPLIDIDPRADFRHLMEQFFDYTPIADHCISIKENRLSDAKEIFEEDPETFVLAGTLLLERQIEHIKRKMEDPEYHECMYGLVFLNQVE